MTKIITKLLLAGKKSLVINVDLTKEQLKQYLDFLNEYKVHLGMSDWKIQISTEVVKMEEIANINPDIYEKEAKLVIGNKFLKKSPDKQYNILLHELVHCRVVIYNEQVDEHVNILEEHFVNDLTRGFELALKEKWTKKNKNTSSLK